MKNDATLKKLLESNGFSPFSLQASGTEVSFSIEDTLSFADLKKLSEILGTEEITFYGRSQEGEYSGEREWLNFRAVNIHPRTS